MKYTDIAINRITALLGALDSEDLASDFEARKVLIEYGVKTGCYKLEED